MPQTRVSAYDYLSPASSRPSARVVVGILLLGVAACTHDPIGRTVPVKGKVTLNGKPLTTGSVVFWPDEENGNTGSFEAGAQINKEGAFDLFTHGKHGAPPGAYRVTVMAQEPIDKKSPYAKRSLLVPEVYTKKDETPLRVVIAEHPPPDAYELKLKEE